MSVCLLYLRAVTSPFSNLYNINEFTSVCCCTFGSFQRPSLQIVLFHTGKIYGSPQSASKHYIMLTFIIIAD
jgi:hypothetical protein